MLLKTRLRFLSELSGLDPCWVLGTGHANPARSPAELPPSAQGAGIGNWLWGAGQRMELRAAPPGQCISTERALTCLRTPSCPSGPGHCFLTDLHMSELDLSTSRDGTSHHPGLAAECAGSLL
uniref:Uncharacterized protein n=1 Tax=Pipistrellus kuhlii TaxID=59472 RepID=A0A7J7VBP3_PIPKU|nr:hypothetical protein mPipKuh1_008532 [Pipistrellus kuhlii]